VYSFLEPQWKKIEDTKWADIQLLGWMWDCTYVYWRTLCAQNL